MFAGIRFPGKSEGARRVVRNMHHVADMRVVVIGAGQAGLSSAYHLRLRGLVPGRDFIVLDHAPRPGGAWQFRWPTLTYGRLTACTPCPA